MKRFFLLFLLVPAMFLAAYQIWTPGAKDNVTFYYPRKEYAYGSDSAIFSSEVRDMAGHIGDTTFLMKMYLLGPQASDLSLPFPKNTRLLSMEEAPDSAAFILSEAGTSLTDIQFTLGCSALAKTYMELRSVSQITVQRGSQNLTVNRSTLVFSDQAANGK